MRATRIVAEVSVNWPQQTPTPDLVKPTATGVISNRFENVIAHNEQRGYKLESWKFSQVCLDKDHMVETIVAVFVATSEQAGEQYT